MTLPRPMTVPPCCECCGAATPKESMRLVCVEWLCTSCQTSTVRDLVADLRGGIPTCCDFCGESREQHELHPEEAGEWACIQCIRAWEAQERQP